MIPKDPVMLLSFVNMKLRDYYRDLDDCCEALQIDRAQLVEQLAAIGYSYDGEANQFR